MDITYDKNLIPLAKQLRGDMTKEERHLWYDFLKAHPIRFQRQRVIGKYIVDFYCSKAKLVIELDGSQHFEESSLEYDKNRDNYLKSLEIKVIRIPNNEITNNFEGVCDYIDNIVKHSIDK